MKRHSIDIVSVIDWVTWGRVAQSKRADSIEKRYKCLEMKSNPMNACEDNRYCCDCCCPIRPIDLLCPSAGLVHQIDSNVAHVRIELVCPLH